MKIKIKIKQNNIDPTLSIDQVHIFYRQFYFPSEPGVANEIFENEDKSCLTVA